MRTNYLILSALFAVLLAAGCGKKQAAAPQPAGNQEQVAVSTDVAGDFIPDVGNYGTVAECPVNKEKIIIGKGTAAVKYKNKIYYLCCPSCSQQFKQNPEKYMNVN